jgi:hypothetical protein
VLPVFAGLQISGRAVRGCDLLACLATTPSVHCGCSTDIEQMQSQRLLEAELVEWRRLHPHY